MADGNSVAISSSNTVIRDCIHGLIVTDDRMRAVVDCRELQRLRWIKQMGLASFIFPTAEHTRFSHALGAFAVSQRVFRRLMDMRAEFPTFFDFPYRLTEEEGRVLGVAALCHDIGHAPFSHALEDTSLFPAGVKDHETCGRAILEESTALRRRIRECCDFDAVKQVYERTHPIQALSQLVSSMYDVDKCDYLLRDSYHLGVQYGVYDLSWLIHLMSMSNDDYILVFDGRKATDALRQFLQARRSMYIRIYLHPTIRAAQMVLRAIFRRAYETALLADRRLIPKVLRSAILPGMTRTLGEFGATTDLTVIGMVEAFSKSSKDPLLKYLCSSFLSRHFFKSVIDTTRLGRAIVFQPGVNETDDLIEQIRDIVVDKMKVQFPTASAMREYFVVLDQISVPPVAISDVYLKFGARLHFLDKVADWGRDYDFGEYTNEYQINRLYVPAEARAAVQEYLKSRGVQP